MANPFGDMAGANKRPAQTIEGTATEIGVEPAPKARVGSQKDDGGQGEGPRSTGDQDPPSSAPPPRTSLPELKGFVTHLAAGLVGGLIGVIALALSWGGFGGGKAPAPDIAPLERRIAKLEEAPAAASDSQALAKMGDRVAAVEDGGKADAAKLSELEDHVAQLQASLKALAKTADEGGSVATAAAVGQQITEAEQRLDAKIADALAKGEAANRSAIEDMQKAIAELKAKLGALAEAELGSGDGTAPQPELAQLIERLAKLEAVVPELADAVDKGKAEARSAALAIAFANLRAAVSDGRPYAAELDTLSSLAPSIGDLGVLPAYAEKGIPTLPELTRSFAATSDQTAPTAAPASDGSLVGSLMAGAQSLVTIKRVDETSGAAGADTALVHAGKALDHGDLAVAVKEVETLQGPAGEAFSTWLGQAHARLAASDTLTRLEGALLISVSGEAETSKSQDQ
jgi:hypothetical protein